MIFKITTDESNDQLCSLFDCWADGMEFYFSVTSYFDGFYFFDASCIRSEPMTLRAFKFGSTWGIGDTKGIFEAAYNVKIEIVDSFPTPD